ncbi:hypothetical protein V8F06_007102 [Rhypophila decipiens]
MHFPHSSHRTPHDSSGTSGHDDGSFSWLQIQPEPAISSPWRSTAEFESENGSRWSQSSKRAFELDALDPERRVSYQLPSSSEPKQTIPPESPASVPAAFLQGKSTRYVPAWTVALLALGTTAVTVWYSYRVMVDINELPRPLQLSPGLTVLVVNVLSHIVAFLALSLSTDILEHLRWALACRPEGILLTSFLAMSRATSITGVLYLFRVPGWHQLWALQRILSYIVTFGISLILIVNVTFKTVYTPYNRENLASTHSVVGGLAPFGITGIDVLDLPMIPMIAASYSVAFITDPRFVAKVAPVNCSPSDSDCLSLLLPGGMELVRIYDSTGEHRFSQSLFSGNFSGDYDTVLINDAPSYQLEYDSIEDVDPLFGWNRTADCNMYGQSIGEGVYMCQKGVGDNLYIGWTICPEEAVFANSCQVDKRWTDDVKWNTTVSAFSRRATVAYDRANISILSVESVSEPVQVKFDSSYLSLYINLVLNPIDPVLNWTNDNKTYSYSAERFAFTYGLSFLLRLYTSNYATFHDGGVYLLRSFIAVPFQFATSMRQYKDGGINPMPAENTVTATLSRSSYRAIIDVWTVWAFSWLSFIIIFYFVGFLLWMALCGPHTPNLSAFPEIDITSKSSLHTGLSIESDMDPHLEMAEQTLEDLGRLTRSKGMGDGKSFEIAKRIHGRRVYCGSLPGERAGDELIVLLTEEAGRLRCLSKENKYC